tara:strand:- start:1538 stop:1675 length:138 start_codon:yes stop_codon:yes gene_type:complete
MVQNYFKTKFISQKQPRSIVIQRILAFSKYYSITKKQHDEIDEQV